MSVVYVAVSQNVASVPSGLSSPVEMCVTKIALLFSSNSASTCSGR